MGRDTLNDKHNYGWVKLPDKTNVYFLHHTKTGERVGMLCLSDEYSNEEVNDLIQHGMKATAVFHKHHEKDGKQW